MLKLTPPIFEVGEFENRSLKGETGIGDGGHGRVWKLLCVTSFRFGILSAAHPRRSRARVCVCACATIFSKNLCSG